jgi:uncharacterized membrane protein YfcA
LSANLVWIATSFVIFLSSGIQSMTGFGFAVLAMPLLVLLQNPHEAVGTSMVLSTLCVVFMWWRTRKHERLHINGRLFAAAIVGVPVGLAGLAWVDANLLRFAVGVITVLIAAMSLRGLVRGREALVPPHGVRWMRSAWIWIAGFVSGFLTGSISMPGPPVVALLSGRAVEKSAYRATLMAYFILIYPSALVAMIGTRLVSVSTLVSSATYIPALLIGMWAGDAMHEKSSESAFAAVSTAILGAAGALCLWAGFSALLAR